MAVLAPKQLDRLRTETRNEFRRKSLSIPYRKGNINAAFQALEDWFETNPSALTGSGKVQMNTAITGSITVSTTLAQRKAIAGVYLSLKTQTLLAEV